MTIDPTCRRIVSFSLAIIIRHLITYRLHLVAIPIVISIYKCPSIVTVFRFSSLFKHFIRFMISQKPFSNLSYEGIGSIHLFSHVQCKKEIGYRYTTPVTLVVITSRLLVCTQFSFAAIKVLSSLSIDANNEATFVVRISLLRHATDFYPSSFKWKLSLLRYWCWVVTGTETAIMVNIMTSTVEHV